MAFTNGYCKKLMLDFRGSETTSGHMAKFLKWYPERDIFKLLDKEKFKNEARSYNGDPMYR